MTFQDTLILISIILFLLGALILLLWGFIRHVKNKWAKNKEGFYVSQRINTEAEEKFRRFLLHIMKLHPETFKSLDLIPQVNLSSIANIAPDKFNMADFNKIGNKSLDFVLIDKLSRMSKLVIELDDRTHLLPYRQKRDALIDQVLTIAKIAILHVKVQRHYDEAEIYGQLLAKLNS